MNHLVGQQSAYLRAHAHQPVDWYPWSEEAFQKAWKENKPIIISIGYASCHWCHVMARECFEDREVARLMNQHFVCIKVDREERPDVDQLYMDALLISGRPGGWPLNCFTLPDGRPFYGVTYLPKKSWMALLERLSRLYRENPQEVQEMARRLSEAIQKLDAKVLEPVSSTARYPVPWEIVIEALLRDIDWIWGGEWNNTKFPMPSRWLFSLRAGILLEKPQLISATHLTLKKMAMGGLFDPIEGGFMRYSTDRFWRIPHFEKLLCDNGLLLALYSEAYRHNPLPLYKEVIQKTAAFLLESLQLPDGLFAASLNAESEGEEGKYYVWRLEELKAALEKPDLQKVFFATYEVMPEGNWKDGQNVLYRALEDEAVAERLGLSVEAVRQALAEAHMRLRQVRRQRVPPERDEAAIIAWNSYAILGLIEAYKALQEPSYLYAARRAVHALLPSTGVDLQRIHKEDRWYGEAFAEDYAAFTVALIALYTVTGNETYLLRALDFMERSLELFYDPQEGVFCFTAHTLRFMPERRKDIFDTSTPSSNSLFAEALWRLSRYFQRSDYQEKVERILARLRRQLAENPTLASHFLQVALLEERSPFAVIYRGPSIAPLWSRYAPEIGWVGFVAQEETAIPAFTSYTGLSPEHWCLCTYGACLRPVADLETLWQLIEQEKRRLATQGRLTSN
ncbi:MAG: thioredoxin domain-containing protein [Bacteroidia bacterium]|nr:thioredoxin domain-containing protein [Bacteroidia bacterium]MDW8088788.1 thioredoxin domain-containing protein [Bacteroidia bacterium]